MTSSGAADLGGLRQRPPSLPAGVPAQRAAAAAGGAWAREHGAPVLGPDPLAAAVAGDQVWVGGGFTYGVAAMASGTYQRVAHWDGTGWRRMGEGVDGTVHALAVHGGDVWAGGEFTVADGRVQALRLARWDGAAWHAVAGGVSDPERTYGTRVAALACDGRTLVVGGVFTRAGDVPAASLAALDLATGTWSDLGGGVASSWSSEPSEVRALALHGRTVWVGGRFDLAGGAGGVPCGGLAAVDLDTGAWTPAPGGGLTDDGTTGGVTALALDPATGALHVGGSFTRAGDVGAWNLAVLRDGRWSSLGDVSSYGGTSASVEALAVSGGRLFLGGGFTAVGGAAVEHLAQWDGAAWSGVGEGLDNVVRALAPVEGGGVVVLGDFGVSGTLRLEHGAVWTGTGWRTFGQGVLSDPYGGGTVSAVVPVGDGAYVGGLFDQAGHLPAGSVARWDGTGWDTMAGGVGAAISHGQVFAMLELDGDLYVAGRFDTAGGRVVRNIARWDGAAWHPLGDGLSDAAHALAAVGGKLYVGGTFALAGRVAAGHLACWDPAAQEWSAVGGAPTYDHDIRALEVVGDRWLVVGGTFQRFFAQGTTVVEGLWGLCLFDTAHEPSEDLLRGYHLLEGVSRYGAPGWVHALRVVGGDLYVGGWFDVAGIMALGERPSAGFPASNLAVWHFAGDGTWEGVGGGTDRQVQALAAVDGALVAAGWFATAGATGAARVARYDPGTRSWEPLGDGLGDGARGGSWALAVAHHPATGVWVGGEFPEAGGAPSANLARWGGPGPEGVSP
ncbi:hypothetical protein [Vallicoccus soli]|uniref:Galactose oxidase n=1 Tax=Vallicoccus soli TaxID=2339232 RepID=A0A3A3YU98_9ACTN|nr:hypothetical protein [Vallicoccus soli]RJK93829.1 hypothetical protein D5H78_16055 [Vallicoccus soli]